MPETVMLHLLRLTGACRFDTVPPGPDHPQWAASCYTKRGLVMGEGPTLKAALLNLQKEVEQGSKPSPEKPF